MGTCLFGINFHKTSNYETLIYLIEPNKGGRHNALTNTALGNNPIDQLYNLRYDRGKNE